MALFVIERNLAESLQRSRHAARRVTEINRDVGVVMHNPVRRHECLRHAVAAGLVALPAAAAKPYPSKSIRIVVPFGPGSDTGGATRTVAQHLGAALRDFVPIGLVGIFSSLLVVNATLPVRTPAELVTYGKENLKTVSFASGNTSSLIRLVALQPRSRMTSPRTCTEGESKASGLAVDKEIACCDDMEAAPAPTRRKSLCPTVRSSPLFASATT